MKIYGPPHNLIESFNKYHAADKLRGCPSNLFTILMIPSNIYITS